ncbi:MAG: thiamine pyrophosphate-dependent dehydrogenase E1 component subunit alpha, partial [Fidelibacterota bacterium]
MKFYGFTKKEILLFFKQMALSRQLDQKQLILLKQGKGFFHIGAAGHEAAQIAAGSCFTPGHDYAFPYYRDQALCLQWGMTSREILLSFLARKDDPNSAGRQMPQHYGHKKLNIVSQSSPTGTQYLQAVGAAFACKRAEKNAVVYVSSGEGTTSQGDFHEALNWASREKAPVIFHIENNGYAISVPVEEQTAGGSIYKIAAGYESLARFNVNGTDLFETRLAFEKAVERARKGKGPGIIVSNVVRLFPHSSSDDQRKYRKQEELEADQLRDPLNLFKLKCLESGICTEKDFDSIIEEVKNQVNEDTLWAESKESPSPETVDTHLFSLDNSIDHSMKKPEKTGDNIVLV